MNHVTEQEWERYQGEVNTARRGLQDFHLRPLDEAIAAYRDEVTVTHQQLVDHDVDVVRRFVGRLMARTTTKVGYVAYNVLYDEAAECGCKDVSVPKPDNRIELMHEKARLQGECKLLRQAVKLFARLNLIQGQQIIRSSIGMPHGGLVTEKRNIQDKLHELRKELRQYE
jgi:hypothetical protein